MTMKIFVDGLLFNHTGIGRIYENLIDGLIRSDEVKGVSTLVPSHMEQAFRKRFPTDKVSVRFTGLTFDFKEYLYKGHIINREFPGQDIYHFVSSNVPFFLRGKVVSTICDLITISPLFGLPWHRRWRFEHPVRHAINRSDHVVCISRFTKSEVCRTFGAPPEKLSVIYPPLSFQEFPGGNHPPVRGDYLLFVGNRHVHKNLRCLFDAFRLLVPEFPGLKTVVAGTRLVKADDVERAMGDPVLRDRIIPLQGATDAQIHALYTHARAFVFPSRIEGFGIPPIEALHAGTPVVCSDIPVLHEVCGDAVRYANPLDPSDFAEKIREILTTPRTESEVTAGRIQARKYAVADLARDYLDLFSRVSNP
jgi:glycosyltransferase involved in cell wall biosynthesis